MTGELNDTVRDIEEALARQFRDRAPEVKYVLMLSIPVGDDKYEVQAASNLAPEDIRATLDHYIEAFDDDNYRREDMNLATN